MRMGYDEETGRDDASLARLSNSAPRVPWDKFIKEIFVWVPGEHLGLIGPTGQGKTTLMNAVLRQRKFVVAFATKPADDTMSSLLDSGYVMYRDWKSDPAKDVPKRILWPDARKLNAKANQEKVFGNALGRIFIEGGWTVAIDELWYFVKMLHLETEIKQFLLQARSLRISLLLASQRPAFIPLEVYDQSTHLFFWRDNDEANLNRLSGISYRSAGMIRQIISNLDRYQVLYINTRTGQMVRTKAPAPRGG